MVQVTAVHLSGAGEHHQYITEMTWKNNQTSATGKADKAGWVQFVRDHPNEAFATDRQGTNAAFLHVVNTPIPYVQTYKDGTWTNNLLSLPRY